jgi:polar amino acid transport system substrate-binding protein
MNDRRSLSAVVGATLLLTSQAVTAQSLTITTEEDPPFNMTVDGKIGGPGTEVVRKVIEAAGMTYSIFVYPWARSYRLAQTQPDTCVYMTVRTEEREPLFKWVGPLANSKWVLYGLESGPKITTLDEARPYRIGGYLGDAKSSFLKSKGFNVEEASSDYLNPHKLEAGRIEFWAQGSLSMRFVAEKEHVTGIVPKVTFNEVLLYLACNPTMSDEVISRLNTAVRKLTDDGTIDALLNTK